VKKYRSILLTNLFMWVVALAAATTLLWGMDELLMMAIAIMAAGAGSHMAVSDGLRAIDLRNSNEPIQGGSEK
jgi:hypothetical protein